MNRILLPLCALLFSSCGMNHSEPRVESQLTAEKETFTTPKTYYHLVLDVLKIDPEMGGLYFAAGFADENLSVQYFKHVEKALHHDEGSLGDYRQSAMFEIRRNKNPEVENYLLRVLKTSKDEKIVERVLWMYSLGSQELLPLAKTAIENKKMGAKIASELFKRAHIRIDYLNSLESDFVNWAAKMVSSTKRPQMADLASTLLNNLSWKYVTDQMANVLYRGALKGSTEQARAKSAEFFVTFMHTEQHVEQALNLLSNSSSLGVKTVVASGIKDFPKSVLPKLKSIAEAEQDSAFKNILLENIAKLETRTENKLSMEQQTDLEEIVNRIRQNDQRKFTGMMTFQSLGFDTQKVYNELIEKYGSFEETTDQLEQLRKDYANMEFNRGSMDRLTDSIDNLVKLHPQMRFRVRPR